MSRAGATLLLFAFCASAAGCGGGQSNAPKQAAPSIVAVIKGLDNPFFSTMRDGLVATAARHGTALRVDAAADVNDAAGQASRLQADAGQGSTCYVVSPINTTNLLAALSGLARKTPIVNIDLPIGEQQAAALGVHVTTFIATDNVAAGEAAAHAMAGFVPQGARVAVLTGPSGDANSQARIDGFEQASAGHFRVVASAAADWDTGKAHSAAANLLSGDKNLRGIFAANDLMALGAVAAVDAAGRHAAVAVVGVDGIREALQNVKTGKLSATVAQYPYTMGQLGIEACLAAARGKTLPRRVDAPLQVVTKRNVGRVQQSFPKPLARFNDPLARLLAK